MAEELETLGDICIAINKFADDIGASIRALRLHAEAARSADPALFGWLHRMGTVLVDFAVHLKSAEATLPEKYRVKK